MKIISFYSDKGGAGATMLNAVLGAHLTYKKNRRVCVVDTVTGGFRSLCDERIDEVNNIIDKKIEEKDLSITNEEFENLKKTPLLGSRLKIFKIEEFNNFLDFLKENKKEFDYILLDISGVSLPNYKFLMKSHFIFLLSTLNEIEKDKKTFTAFERLKIKKTKVLYNLDDVYLLLNKVQKKRDYENRIGDLKKNEELNLLQNIVYERSTFTDYSTISGLIDKSIEMEMINEEIYKLINK